MEVVAIYFPSWHPNPHYEAWYGKGFSEWELVKTARPLFAGHHQPKVPVWGYFDESDPSWAEKEIDLAADHGITAFLFDWYWYSGVQLMHEALENGFLKAPNRNRLKFSIMWANHDWGTWPALAGLGAWTGEKRKIWLPIRHDVEDLDRVVDFCCQHYFSQPNYWRINGRPNFTIYQIDRFVAELGGVENTRTVLKRMDARAQKNGMPGIHFSANIGCCDDNQYCCGWGRVSQARELGFESVFAYNIVRTTGFNAIPDHMPVVEYEDVITSHEYCWAKIEEGGLPHFPVVTTGCDVSPRWHRDVKLPMDFKSLHYEPIIINNTPAQFGRLCALALKKAAQNRSSCQAIMINAWNEWTEGMFLLPEKRFGAGYLESLKRALNM